MQVRGHRRTMMKRGDNVRHVDEAIMAFYPNYSLYDTTYALCDCDISHFNCTFLCTFGMPGIRPDARCVSKVRLLSQDLLLIWQVATSAS